MHDPNCIFCKIIKGEIPSEKTHHEDGEIYSLPDIHPVAPGHTLIIPSSHYRWFYELPDGLSDKLMKVAKKLARGLKEKHSADYVELKIIGIDVPHTHIHLIPRRNAISS